MKPQVTNKIPLMSLYDYFGKGQGPELGRRVYAYAKKSNIAVDTRDIDNKKWKGKIMLYPTAFLDYYFVCQEPDVLNTNTR